MRAVVRFIGAALLVLVVLALNLKLKAVLGWSPDILLPALVAAGFFLNLYSLALLVLLVVWVLNWQAGLPSELIIFAIVPFAAWLGKKFSPLPAWLTLTLIIVLGEVLLYAISVPGAFFGNIGFIALNTAFAALLGFGLISVLEYIYGQDRL
jgi:hypothetical protein